MGRVVLSDVRKEYGDVVAVKGSDLTVEDGEFVSLVGPSGCGKSTTLQMIAGLTEPSDGTILIDGDDVTEEPPQERDLTMVFQDIALLPHLNVRENIGFGLDLQEYPSDVVNDRVHEALELLQLAGLEDRMPAELSGGQRQRVAIGRALVMEPGVFLMDEPLASLDAKLRNHMRTEIQRLHKRLETTTVYVTHDQEEAMTMSDRIVVMDNGEIQQVGPPLSCYDRPTNLFVAGFIGSPAMNQLRGTLDGRQFDSELVSVTLPPDQARHLATEREVVLGIRPEHVTVETDAGRQDPERVLRVGTMTVDVVQPLGDTVYVYLVTGEESNLTGLMDDHRQLLATVEPDEELSPGDVVEVTVESSDVHVFASTGEALLHGYDPVDGQRRTGERTARTG